MGENVSGISAVHSVVLHRDELPLIGYKRRFEMKKYTDSELRSIIEDHGKWLSGEGGERANLRGVDLRGANLRGVDLIGANLSGANLSGVDLGGVDLIGANLRGVDLKGANLSGVDLSDANLDDIQMWSTCGNGIEIKSYQTGIYDIVIFRDVIQIGCERHLFNEWMEFTDHEISEMDDGALEFWGVWKSIIIKIYAASSNS